MQWARWHRDGYEVTSQGDKRFSAFFAWLKDGRSIEEAYQLDVKGWRAQTNDYKEVKGNLPLLNKTRAQLWHEYLKLWRQWAVENPDLIEDLRAKSHGKVLTDRFSSGDLNQAHALAVILTELEHNEVLPFSF